MQNRIVRLVVMTGLLSSLAAQEPSTPWRNDPLFQGLAAALDPVPAIDTHTHLQRAGKFNPALATVGPLLNRSTHPWFPSVLKWRFGITVDAGDWSRGIEAIATAGAAMVMRLGEHGYWMDHLDYGCRTLGRS